MILIADSGATKADWRLLENKDRNMSTLGVNPYFNTTDEIIALLYSELVPQLGDVSIDEIYVYAAGVANAEKAYVIEAALSKIFPSSSIIEVCSDLLGTARALCGRQPGIACILGTGSNSCYYDGENIIDNVPPCGFILGDEGSGSVMGRKLLSAFLKRDLAQHLCEKLRFEYGLSKDIILERVYREANPNRFLAQYARFLSKYVGDPTVDHIVTESLEEFFDRNVLKYDNARQFPVHFTGSVAFFFEKYLRKVAESRNINIGQITRSPIEGMLEYHRTVIYEKNH